MEKTAELSRISTGIDNFLKSISAQPTSSFNISDEIFGLLPKLDFVKSVLEEKNSADTTEFIDEYSAFLDLIENAEAKTLKSVQLRAKNIQLLLRVITLEYSVMENSCDEIRVLQKYLAKAPVAFCVLKGENFVLDYANDLYFQIIARDKSSIGKPLRETLPEFEHQRIFKIMQEVYEGGETFVIEELEVIIIKDGAPVTSLYNVTYKPYFLRGKILGITIAFSDVTIAGNARDVSKESEKDFRNLVDQSPVAMAILIGEDLTIDMANERMLKVFWRKKLSQVKDKTLLQVFPELSEQIFPKLLLDSIKTGKTHKEEAVEAYIDSDDGRKLYIIDFEYAPIFNKNQKPFGVMVTAIDVTEKTKLFREVAEAEEKYRLLSDAMPQFVWTANPQGELNFFNKSVLDYSGYDLEHLLNGGWLDIVNPEEREENVKRWVESIESGEEFFFEHRFRRHDGEYRWQLSRAVPYRDANGNIQSWIGTSTDIQQHKDFQKILTKLVDERTKELKQANIQLESSNQELSSFAYISSHDLQEPLRKIQTFISIINDSDHHNLSERGRINFEKMHVATTRMKTLINDLLTYSRTSADDKFFEITDIQHLLMDVKKDFAETLEAKDGQIIIGDFPPINAIPFQLRQLFTNLISNSLKFAKKGIAPIVTITSKNIIGKNINSEKAFRDQNYLNISVKDNGIGFNKEYEDKIFEVFARLHGKSQYEGTGIGLAIVKKIVENHNAIITAESKTDDGATFNIYIPIN